MLKNKNYLETVSMESQHQVLLHSYVNTAVVDECIVCTYFTRTFLSLHRAACIYILYVWHGTWMDWLVMIVIHTVKMMSSHNELW